MRKPHVLLFAPSRVILRAVRTADILPSVQIFPSASPLHNDLLRYSRTLNDILSANLLVFVIQFLTGGSGNNCEKIKLSGDTRSKKKKQTNFSDGRLI